MNNLKVEGKVSDWCPKCKNCKGATRESNGIHVWLTEVECEDPFDGVVKTLTADSDICCSMFEKKDLNPLIKIAPSRMKSEKSCDKISLLQHELEMGKLRRKIHELEKEKAAHLKGIERLKNKNDKLKNEIDNLKETNESLTKMVERRDRWVKELRSDVYTLQNEILTIRNIAQKAYDDTNRD